MGPDYTGPLATMSRACVVVWSMHVRQALDDGYLYSEVGEALRGAFGRSVDWTQIRAMHCACLRLVDRHPWSVAAESAGYPSTMAGMMAVRRLFAVDGKPRLPEWAE